jgi:hypothetical protein
MQTSSDPVVTIAAGDTKTRAVVCARCGAPFCCGIDDPKGCWCAKLPALPQQAYDDTKSCLCEGCLRQAVNAAADPSSGQTG